MHPMAQRIRLELLPLQRAHWNSQDSTENDPQLRRETQVIRPWGDPILREGERIDDRGECSSASEQSTGLRRLRPARSAIRSLEVPTIRVCSIVVDRRVLRVPDASCRLSAMWSHRRACSLGRRSMPFDDRWFLAAWAKLLSWQEVADVFHTSHARGEQAALFSKRSPPIRKSAQARYPGRAARRPVDLARSAEG
jgi:hypothetical protein